jgi:NACHT domain
VLDILAPHIVPDAYYNSLKREGEHTSTCHPDTHTRILGEISEWATGNEHSVCWLRGPAGTGKSTIAHTIAERHQDGWLAGTFFFSRGKGAREDIAKLIPTLAYQIAARIPSSQARMHDALHKDPALLTQSLRRQFLKLIVEPLVNVETPRRFLVVIDGLDECAARDRVVDLIGLLGDTMTTHEYPLQFLLTSRPEPEIHAAFQQHIVGGNLLWLALEDSRDDVRKYLQEKLMGIRRNYRSIMVGEPVEWPSSEDLEELVRKSEGLFIYASTLVQYMDDRQEPPQEKLGHVLKVHKGVDALYTQVLTEVKHKDFDRVIGSIMYLRYPLPINKLAQLLGLDVSNIRMALDRCHSVLAIPDDNNETIRPYHASLRDFLTNQARSQDFFLAPAKFHALIAITCLKGITDNLRLNRPSDQYISTAWYHHCASLLSDPSGNQDFQSLREQVSGEVKKVDAKWLKYWMVEAFTWAGVNTIRVELPSSKVSG